MFTLALDQFARTRGVWKLRQTNQMFGAVAHRSISTNHFSISVGPESDTVTAIRESVRTLCDGFPGSYWRELEKKSEYPTEFVQELTKSGYLSLLIPSEYGGSGLSIVEASAVLEEVHRSGCNGGAAHAQMYTMGTILRFGTDEQKSTYLPEIASGNLRLQAFGVSEPNSGTDTLSLETTAERQQTGDYIVNGQKMWTSRAEHSDLMLLLARTSSDVSTPEKRRKSLSVFLVDMKEALASGSMQITPIDTMINHSTCQVFFDELRIPKENLIAKEGDGLKCILSSMNAERILIASECIGDGRFFIDRATDYANERSVFGRKIGQNQGIQFPLAKAYASIEAANLMVQSAAGLYLSGSAKECGAQANMAKMLASEASWEAADACMQTLGGYAFARDFDVERKFRETRLYRTAPISTNLILSFIGEKVLHLPRSF